MSWRFDTFHSAKAVRKAPACFLSNVNRNLRDVVTGVLSQGAIGIDCHTEDIVSAKGGNVEPLAVESAAVNVSPAGTDTLISAGELGRTGSRIIFYRVEETESLFASAEHHC